MDKINFIELAIICHSQIKEQTTVERRKIFKETLYVAISEDNQIKISQLDTILSDAHKCMLIHRSSEKAETIWYDHYYLQIIDERGCVKNGELDDGFSVVIYPERFNVNSQMTLRKDGRDIYTCYPPYDRTLEDFWNVYLKARECSTTEEAALLGRLAMKDREILKLKRDGDSCRYANQLLTAEKNLYKGLLDQIQKMINEVQ